MSTEVSRRGRFDVGDVKDAARGQWPEVLSAVVGIPRDVLDGKHHPCPSCQGHDRFRLLNAETGAVICNSCFNQRNGDGIAAVMHYANLTFPQALQAIAEHVGLQPVESDGPTSDVLALVARQKKVTVDALLAYGASVLNGAVVFPTWEVTGQPLGTFRIDLRSEKGSKGLFETGATAGLFLPVVDGKSRMPQPGETWHVVEGVKDAAALWALGFLAVGLPTCRMHQRFAPLFRGVHVVFVPDRDKAGDTGAHQAAARLFRISASSKIATLPAEYKESKGADVRDILALPDGERQLREAIANASAWTPAAMKVNGQAEKDPKLPEGWPDVAMPDGQTDVANGRRLRLKFGDRFRWCDPWSKFLFWDGRRWAIDKALSIDALAREVYQGLWEEFAPKALGMTREELTRCSSFIKGTGSARGIRSMLERVRSEDGIPILPDRLDQHPHYLNLQNGTLDLQVMEMHSHRPGDWLTQLCPVEYLPTATCPTWEKFIDSVFANDAELIDFVQRSMGLSLCGDVSEHALFFCYGTGSNGKSTLLNILLHLLGDYSCKASSELLLLSAGHSHPTGLTDLFGKRFVACIEADEGKRLAESMVKEMTGADKIRARRMREDHWEFKPTHKIWLAANHKPTIRGTDDGLWRRIKLIPFAVKFDGASKDRTMPEKLTAELPGILNWAIAGYRRWREFGLEAPQIITDAVAEYRSEMDIVGQFIDELCIVNAGVKVKAGQLFDAYRRWAGDSAMTQTKFGRTMTSRGFEKRKVVGNVWYDGIALADSSHPDEEQFR